MSLEEMVDKACHDALEFYRWLEKETIQYAAGKTDQEHFDTVLLAVKLRAENLKNDLKSFKLFKRLIAGE